jgi:hypothetical protein
VLISVSQGYVASFPAFRAIVHAVDRQANIMLGLAEAAELLARALHFRFVALRTQRRSHRRLFTLPAEFAFNTYYGKPVPATSI